MRNKKFKKYPKGALEKIEKAHLGISINPARFRELEIIYNSKKPVLMVDVPFDDMEFQNKSVLLGRFLPRIPCEFRGYDFVILLKFMQCYDRKYSAGSTPY